MHTVRAARSNRAGTACVITHRMGYSAERRGYGVVRAAPRMAGHGLTVREAAVERYRIRTLEATRR